VPATPCCERAPDRGAVATVRPGEIVLPPAGLNAGPLQGFATVDSPLFVGAGDAHARAHRGEHENHAEDALHQTPPSVGGRSRRRGDRRET
jgi:hypothetical protein